MAYYRIDDVRTESVIVEGAQSAFTYVEVSIWPNRGAFQRGEAPAEVQDFRMQLPAVGAVQNFKRKRGQNFVRADDTEWTPAEYEQAVRDYRKGLRQSPRLELAFDSVAIDHAAHIEFNIANYIDKREAAGAVWRGDARDKRIQARAPEANEVANLPAVQALKRAERERGR